MFLFNYIPTQKRLNLNSKSYISTKTFTDKTETFFKEAIQEQIELFLLDQQAKISYFNTRVIIANYTNSNKKGFLVSPFSKVDGKNCI